MPKLVHRARSRLIIYLGLKVTEAALRQFLQQPPPGEAAIIATTEANDPRLFVPSDPAAGQHHGGYSDREDVMSPLGHFLATSSIIRVLLTDF